MNLGKKIAELRKKNNLSQEELAEKVGVLRFFRNVTFLIIKQISNKGKLC